MLGAPAFLPVQSVVSGEKVLSWPECGGAVQTGFCKFGLKMVSDLPRLSYGSSADVFTKIGALE